MIVNHTQNIFEKFILFLNFIQRKCWLLLRKKKKKQGIQGNKCLFLIKVGLLFNKSFQTVLEIL